MTYFTYCNVIDFYKIITYINIVRKSMRILKGCECMELAKITKKGQITIPVRIRKMLNLKDGDKVVFMPQGNTVVMDNSTRLALREAQQEFSGLKEELGLETEEDVIALCKQVRQEMWEKKYSG